MLAAFKREARPLLDRAPANHFEWMFLAQHHGLPTRLLDWSTNALVALYFAAESARGETGDPAQACAHFVNGQEAEVAEQGFAVFIIDPSGMNEESGHPAMPVDVAADVERWQHFIDPPTELLPIAIVAPKLCSRIRAQSGTFTLHGMMVRALETYEPLRRHMTKIFVPYSCADTIRSELEILGMSKGFIYADLDGVAADIAEREARIYRLWRDAEDLTL